MPRDWEKCLKEGDELFQYMIHHYEEMFDKDRIEHFNIWYATWWIQSYYRVVNEQYGGDIQAELIPWIRNELEFGRLVHPAHWKPFYDTSEFQFIYMGYNKLFLYQNYYFQLIVQLDCGDCMYCDNQENQIHFELALYGWKDEHSERLLPYNKIHMGSDQMVPDTFWNII